MAVESLFLEGGRTSYVTLRPARSVKDQNHGKEEGGRKKKPSPEEENCLPEVGHFR